MKTRPFFNIFPAKQQKSAEMPAEKKLMDKKIIVDYREKNSFIPSELMSREVEVEFRELKVGDYIIGNIIIERKTISDFISSMINKRLLNQIEDLKQYPDKLLIIEGTDEQELYTDNNEAGGINPNSIRGFLLSIVLRHKIPIILTKNAEDTARYFILILNKKENELSLKQKKKSKNKKEQMQFIIEGFPGIGPKTAKKLLKEFKTIKGIINADEDKLKKMMGKKATGIINLINQGYLQ